MSDLTKFQINDLKKIGDGENLPLSKKRALEKLGYVNIKRFKATLSYKGMTLYKELSNG